MTYMEVVDKLYGVCSMYNSTSTCGFHVAVDNDNQTTGKQAVALLLRIVLGVTVTFQWRSNMIERLSLARVFSETDRIGGNKHASAERDLLPIH